MHQLQAVLPHLVYALIFVALWACIPARRTRHVALTIAAIPLVIALAFAAKTFWQVSQAAADFDSQCTALGNGEILATANSVDGIGTDYPAYKIAQEPSISMGQRVLGLTQWSDVYLGGIVGYNYVEEWGSENSFSIRHVVKGRIESDFRKERKSRFTIGWQPTSMSLPSHVSGAELQIIDSQTRTALAKRTMLELRTPAVLFPGLPLILRAPENRVCPRPTEMIQFIKTVAVPPPHPL